MCCELIGLFEQRSALVAEYWWIIQVNALAFYNAISYAEVNTAFVANGSIITLSDKELKQINFVFLSYGLGHATPKGSISFKAVKTSSTSYLISDFSIDMTVEDIYDFWYNNTAAARTVGSLTIHSPKEAASIQCGHGLLGNAVGQVIYVVVDLKKHFTFPNRSVIQ